VLRWNFFGRGKDAVIDGADFNFVVKDKNTIIILQIVPKRFSEVMWNARYFAKCPLRPNVGAKRTKLLKTVRFPSSIIGNWLSDQLNR
jgi:hypothetical protein